MTIEIEEKDMKTSSAASVLAGTLLVCLTSSGTTWYVSPDGTGDGLSASTRGEAITTVQKMKTGDTLMFATGTYNLDVTKVPSGKTSYFRIPDGVSNLTFLGESENPEDVRLMGRQSDKMRVFYFPTGGHVCRNLLISGGWSDYQGAGFCMGDTWRGKHEQAYMVSNCVVENCSAFYKGASRGGVWRNCVIRNNEVRNTTHADNSGMEGVGGGVYNATLYDCVVTNNVAGYCGGGIAGGVDAGVNCPTRATNCLIGWNRARLGGGAGISQMLSNRALCTLVGCTVVSNVATYSGAVWGKGGGAWMCMVSNSVVRGNVANRDGDYSGNESNTDNGGGGGVASCDVYDSLIEGNRSRMGGAGATQSRVYRCRLVGNDATGGTRSNCGYGGATFKCDPVEDCYIAGNRGHYGGAAFNGNLVHCLMTNNIAATWDGGATYNATSRNCIVVGNVAQRGYAHCRGWHFGDLVYANRNSTSGRAGGIGHDASNASEPLPVVNCTVWGNANGYWQIQGASMTNTITQSIGTNADVPMHAAVNSFWRAGTTTADTTGSIFGTDKDPCFVGVKTNDTITASTPVEAFGLRAGSPCRDAGVTLAGQTAGTDAIGNPRVKYGSVDMGALEYCNPMGSSIFVR